MISSCIYNGNVIHKRFKPKEHFFKYKVFSLFIDLSELNELNNKLKFFSLNKFNLISFYEKDHGDRDGSSLFEWVKKNLINNENTLYLKKCSLGLYRLWMTVPLYIHELIIKVFQHFKR